MRFIKSLCIALTLVAMTISTTGCLEDLKSESKDLRTDTSVGGDDSAPAVDFIELSTESETIQLSSELMNNDAVVLYYTMWCPICDSHMSHLRSNVVDHYRNVRYLVVDYVSGSVAQSRNSQVSNGYASFTVLSDSDQSLIEQFNATMGTTVVIDDQNKILMNEDYKNGARLIEVLETLQ
ncbi:peroxiredoxin family protein [Alkalimarinus alittae]|uniref:Peroxiredoxin family protein n=1 Tax=Alkalimarinus alittae TaxID=2961619 RepID=A0ABY6N2L9_9ALTE|nr:peroxiredoxin family protein [Alkalimarinus alittae]UZE96343.1 peroxiredoxin family protein [Alkalimarinus alittae]